MKKNAGRAIKEGMPSVPLRRSVPAVLVLAVGFLISRSLVAAEPVPAASALPKAQPGWKVSLVAEPPQLVHPSVVCCAPDGRVFVAQDPIDMGLPSNSTGDSILCFHPDGHVTLFATNLHAVFGLAYIDGKLFVHHTPDFSVFIDDNGVGKERKDLFTTNPNPNLNGSGFNDHIPSNIRLGMDGWLYMSTGDKGIYGAVGKDGSKVNLQGGGVMRFRPDGTHLEIYANGTRNHLDVAINAEDEIFTYDNTDDGLGWWTRVTHMVDGGYYAYPYDYKKRQPYTLWMIGDYGGGSPTGALAYNEDALPEEYRGNLFLCEWGRGQLLRLRVSREGGSYKIDSRVQTNGLDFLSQGDKPFRPVGIAVAPDGLSFYVGDWNFSGWKKNEPAGRLLKVTYTGPSPGQPKPEWFVPAAMGKPVQASNDELIAGLKHPAQSVRMVAQRRLAERGQAVVPALKTLLADAKAPAYARWHAIWTLDALDGGRSARQEIIAVATADADVSVRAQAIRQLGTARAGNAVKTLGSALKDGNAEIRFRAATALGRIGDGAAVPSLISALDEKDLFTRYSVFKALNRIGKADTNSWMAIAAGLQSTNATVRQGTLFAMRETYDEQNVKALAGFVASPKWSAESRAQALATVAELHRERPAWTGGWWSTQPAKDAPPAKTVEWAGTPSVLASLTTALKDTQVAVRRAAVDALALIGDTNVTGALCEMYPSESAEMKRAILKTLGGLGGTNSGALVAGILADPAKNSDVLPQAIDAAGHIKVKTSTAALINLASVTTNNGTTILVVHALGEARSSDSVSVVAKMLRHSDSKIRHDAAEALASIGGTAALDAITGLLSDTDKDCRHAAITAAGLLKDKRVVTQLLESYQTTEYKADALEALTKVPDAQALDAYVDGLNSATDAVRDNCRNAIERIRDKVLSAIEEKHRKKPFTGQALAALQRVYNYSEVAKKGPLFKGTLKVEAYANFAEKTHGDPVHGQKVFGGPAGCVTCHRIDGKGGEVGPELTGVAAKYNRTFLVESVLYPSKQILDGYHSTIITTKDDESYTGFIRSENSRELTLLQGSGEKRVISKKQIVTRAEGKLSVMPEGLQAAMSLSEFADLVAYLESLKEKPAVVTRAVNRSPRLK
ncbi:MAG: HEAT repeat domain-containing protein [Limisphaerales bacterium]